VPVLPRDTATQRSKSAFKELLARPGVLELLNADEVPIPPAGNRNQYYAGRDLDYWLSGYRDKLMIEATCGVHHGHILDFGGSSGRVIRHFSGSKVAGLHLCDLHERYITWARQNLPGVTAFTSTPAPPLDFDDGFFDLIFAFSVFTHIDEHEIGWLRELRRLLKHGGRLLVTIHNGYTWQMIPTMRRKISTEVLPRSPGYLEYRQKNPELRERVVFTYGSISNVFFPDGYVEAQWSSIMHIDEIFNLKGGHQAAVAMTKA
jgi:SAM-dependent methyltransferase